MSKQKQWLGVRAKQAKPTRHHRPAVWEVMLGTVIEEMVQYYKVERPKVWERLDIDLNDPDTQKDLIQTWFNLGKHIVEEG